MNTADVTKEINLTTGVIGIEIDIETNVVEIQYSDRISADEFTTKLHKMGSPLRGSVNGFEAFKTSAKSVASYIIARKTKQE